MNARTVTASAIPCATTMSRSAIPTTDRAEWGAVGGVALAAALCWAWTGPMAVDMYGSMQGAAAWMMTDDWDWPHVGLLGAMWVVMMTGMMLPSILPALWRARPAKAAERRAEVTEKRERTGVRGGAAYFVIGYITAWTGFSVIATALHRLLDRTGSLSPMMELRDDGWGTVALVAAGLYQFTPWKRRWLGECRCADDGVGGGWRGGLGNGLCCVGGCWALMMLLFVGGVMNIWWNIGLTVYVWLEKVVRPGRAADVVRVLPLVLAVGWAVARWVG